MSNALQAYNRKIPEDGGFSGEVDKRPAVLKHLHFIQSLFKEIEYVLNVLFYRYSSPKPKFYNKEITWNKDSQGLIIFIHGLHSDPSTWFQQALLLSKNTKVDSYAPIVPKRGVCSLDEATKPLLPKIIDYTKKNPGKPVCLLGASNGGRIALSLESKLRYSTPRTPVKISSIAGVHFGSSRVNRLEKHWILKWFCPGKVKQELKFGSTRAERLLEQVKKELPKNCAPRSYDFYATREDLLIPDLSSTLPELGKGEKAHIINGVGHSSIVAAVAREQMDSCFQWIQSFQSRA